MSDFYHDKRVYITGGSSGIGLALACAVASRGAHVAIFARSKERRDQACEKIAIHRQSSSQNIQGYELDVQQLDKLPGQLTQVQLEFGTPDIVITSAGVAVAKPFEQHTLEDFQQNMDTNVLGTAAFVHALVPAMKMHGGNIVMIGSLGGLIPTWGYSAYSASKAALVGLAEVLDSELCPLGIKVSLVCPSEAATPMIAAEAASVPVQTRFLKDLLGTTTAEAVAESTLAGVEKGKFLIIHGFRGKSAYLIKRLFPNLMRVSTALLLTRLNK